jgi:hypothetical protein
VVFNIQKNDFCFSSSLDGTVAIVSVAHNLLHCRVVEDPIRVMMSQTTVLGDVSSDSAVLPLKS